MNLRSSFAVSSILLAAGCAASSEDGAPDAGYSHSDLAGSYRFVTILQGPTVLDGGTPGWIRGKATIDETGLVTVTASEDSNGGHPVPVSPPTWNIDSKGIVTSSSTMYPTLWGKMDARRNMIVATATQAQSSTLRIFLKDRPGVTYGASDLASKSFAYHYLAYGQSTGWEHGVAAFDAATKLSLGSRIDSTGAQPDSTVGTVLVSTDGVVTLPGNPSWQAYLSADKSAMVVTKTRDPDSPAFGVNVLTQVGSSYATTDLAGSYALVRFLVSGAGGGWAHLAADIDANGTVTTTSMMTSGNVTTIPGPVTLTLGGDGVLLNPSSPSFHGVLNASRDTIVRTETIATPTVYSQLSFGLK